MPRRFHLSFRPIALNTPLNPADHETASEAASNFRQYRAPRNDGEVCVDPGFDSTAALFSSNRAILAEHDSHWQELRTKAREKLISDALRYTSAYRDTSWVDRSASSSGDRPIIMAGHQPSLFHPGVWFKNFALSHLAEKLGVTAVNLVVDNDVAKSSSIRVPTKDANGNVVARSVSYDEAGGGVPYEQTTIRNLDSFDRFAAEVQSVASPLVDQPCVDQLWKHAKAAVERCGVAGCALAAARHSLEGDVGLRTLEIPLSVVCRGPVFAEFALSILSELPRFQECYNDSTHYYRRCHGIRSNAHPVSDLAEQDGWLEAPLWIYGNQSPNRKAAWVKLGDGHLEISDLGNRSVRINTTNLADAIDQLSAVMTPEFKIRPRALLTTMYSRLMLSDLFLHGIGGGKYDQLGDLITKSFFKITPPEFMVLSATVHLPDVQPRDVAADVRHLKRQIRETHFQPERFANEATLPDSILQRKQELLASIPSRGEKQAWHQEISQLNRELSSSLDDVRADLQEQLVAAQRRANAQSILESREHPFCVYPLQYLTQKFDELLSR